MAETTDDRLRLLIERVERLEEEKKGIADDIRDVYAEAKAVGYDAKIMRQIVRLRKMKPDDRLRLLIERVERLEEEKKGIADDIRDVYAEAKAVGYDTKIMRQIVRLRKMKPDDRAEMEAILDTYKAALGLE